MTPKQLKELIADNMKVRENDKLLFICPTCEEYDGFLKALAEQGIHTQILNSSGSVRGFTLGSHSCIVRQIGITFFNSHTLAIALANIIFKSEFVKVINVGTCASISHKYKIGDIIVTKNTVCNDLDLTSFGYKLGTLTKDSYEKEDLIVSGSKFLDNEQSKQDTLKKFPTAVAFDMETFYYKRICDEFNVDFVVVRAVSDDGSKEIFDSNVGGLAREIGLLCIKVFSKYL